MLRRFKLNIKAIIMFFGIDNEKLLEKYKAICEEKPK